MMQFPRRMLLTCLAVFLLLPTAIAAQTPSASPAGSKNLQTLDIDGIPVALSPDGTQIAGIKRDPAQLCVWDIASLESICSDTMPVPITQRSVVWSPDSTAVAFSLDAAIYIEDSDIYVLETQSGITNNLTDDDPDDTGADAISISRDNVNEVPLDVFPAWSPDSQQLVFARTVWSTRADTGTKLMTISRNGGEPQKLVTLHRSMPFLVYSPMQWLQDGSILVSTWHPRIDDPLNSIRRVTPEGKVTDILSGHPEVGVPSASIASVTADGSQASIYSYVMLNQFGFEPGTVWFRMDTTTGAFEPWETVLGLATEPTQALASNGPGVLIAAPVFGPDDASVAFMTRVGNGPVHVSIMDAQGTVSEIATIDPDTTDTTRYPAEPRISWASNNTLLVILPDTTVLMSL